MGEAHRPAPSHTQIEQSHQVLGSYLPQMLLFIPGHCPAYATSPLTLNYPLPPHGLPASIPLCLIFFQPE